MSSHAAISIEHALAQCDVHSLELVSADESFSPTDVGVSRAISELLKVVRESLKMEVLFLGEITQGRRVFRHVSASIDPLPLRVGDSNRAADTVCQRVLDGRLPAIIPSVRRIYPAHGLAPEDHEPVLAHIGVPVYLPQGRLYGVLCGFNMSRTDTFKTRDLQRMRMAASAAARILAQAEGLEVQITVRGALR